MTTTHPTPTSARAGSAAASAPESRPQGWKDSKKYSWAFSLIPAAIPLIAWGIVEWLQALNGPQWLVHATWWAGPISVFILIPLADLILGRDGENVPEEFVPWLEETKFYRIITYLYFPIMLASIVACCYLWTSGDLTLWDKLGLAWSMGMTSGIGIVAAHELGHKKGSFERWMGKITLAIPAYGHFYIEHNKGHHVKVATPEDPVSSRMGENVYTYLVRSIPQQIPRAWGIERKRLARKGKPSFHISNEVLNAWLVTVVVWGGLFLAFGWTILPWMLIQAVIGIALLEFVNYLEHYGLLRQLQPDGRYERCSPEHSWNSDNLTTNIFLYQLQRHSDHHANPTRRYQSLRSDAKAPELPAGYATMIFLASIPPLWFAVMNRRLMKHYGGDIRRANVLPRKRDALAARWHTADEGESHV
ncbi:alkane 1-monooxygenase [Corynebacterium sp. 320]|uniref:alkane 1-monooxygenase n=1 Tax=Corynebacterium TaxID=1716 RepID=UPI00125CACC1|nr:MULTISPECIES: alkane 1-monooxygenase [Corynebacterium]KAB1504436.1 alkane 1-monooxygenase [Corynebacterium sp. 320]KAB1552465.1 alkane 1-monooxygenase [Corynebacterium sp. 321]KAB1554320.1 alkane 1-monooxygenase [Corynebacterium sp. 319]KAB3528572.1 alkane 1-monooxygenase [Corynebacterium sp. 250]KAB3539936.1 alkane 1-monooxygenase [Corynebacterium sp. 366]